MKAIEKQIAARLISAGELTESDLQKALKRHTGHVSFQEILVEKGYVSPRAITRALAEVNGFEFIELAGRKSDPQALGLLRPREAWQNRVLPLSFEGEALAIALADPNDVYTPDHLRLRFGCQILVQIAEKTELEAALRRAYGPESHARFDSSSSDMIDRRSTVLDEEPNSSTASHYSGSIQVSDDQFDRESSESHRVYQRRVREMRERGSISELETVMDDSDGPSTIELAERRLMESSQDLPRQPDPHDTPARMDLERILRQATESRVGELEFTPVEKCVGVRFRRGPQWMPLGIYPIAQHEEFVRELIRRAGLHCDYTGVSPDREVQLETPAGELPCRLAFQETEDGPRIVVRFPENQPLLKDPLLAIGLGEHADRINQRLKARAGGLLFLSAPNTRTLEIVYTSLLGSLGQANGTDILSLETAPSRRLPGVTSTRCQSEDKVRQEMEKTKYTRPDVLGISAIESSELLRAALDLSTGGTAFVACLCAPDWQTARACFTAAKIDPMNVVRGLIGHIHIEAAKRLCTDCARRIDDRSSLPQWARETDAEFYRGTGCEECKGTGYNGTVYLVDFFEPGTASSDGSLVPVIERQTGLLAAAIAGEIDPRDFPASS